LEDVQRGRNRYKKHGAMISNSFSLAPGWKDQHTVWNERADGSLKNEVELR
jgi:hypothetical protein